MASIFTFDPDPPRVASPWSTPRAVTPKQRQLQPGKDSIPPETDTTVRPAGSDTVGSSLTVTRLEAEPQEGPTEYKLHLLLRPRRSFTSTSTVGRLPSSQRFQTAQRASASASASRSASESDLANALPLSASHQSRQHRLEQLTTQLLWRLQQSAPYHSSAADNVIIPHLPETSQKLVAPSNSGKVLPGLEDSRGALYEIGVADDGTFVGLAHDEMEESLNNLRAMAASLGCSVEVLRMVPVGECEWVEQERISGQLQAKRHSDKLWVAEAYIRPDSKSGPRDVSNTPSTSLENSPAVLNQADVEALPSVEQLRVSLTGATTSGKSSLLGTLTTATLDNGRGKSRLSLLKHRHEIVTGMTSSVTQELIGYRDVIGQDSSTTSTHIVNYAVGNVSSWTDIHASTGSGRLVFLSDSAGHPRYRRTIVRGLVGWDPHWTLLCIPADNGDNVPVKHGSSHPLQSALNAGAAEVDLSHAHLELCLDLQLPLVVVITKLDLASKPGLRQTLSKVLSMIKSADRKPMILTDTSNPVPEEHLTEIPRADVQAVDQAILSIGEDYLSTVPIVLTSAVKGNGIGKLHALLHRLPIRRPATPPTSEEATDAPSKTLFHIEDVYNALRPNKLPTSPSDHRQGCIISGHLRYGIIRVGDELLIGPYPPHGMQDDDNNNSESSPLQQHRRSSLTTSRSFPGALHEATHRSMRRSPAAAAADREWRRVRVDSLRNLRLPVRVLHAGQVGTAGLVPVGDQPILTPAIIRVRKGMVLADGRPKAVRTFLARFERRRGSREDDGSGAAGLAIGSAVVVYVSSVRASAKVVSVAEGRGPHHVGLRGGEDGGLGFGAEEEREGASGRNGVNGQSATLVSFQFIGPPEYVEMGAQVFIMPGGGPGLYAGNQQERGEKGLAGLEGFVGRVVAS